MLTTYYQIAENIYVQGERGGDGVEIDGGAVKAYIESEKTRIQSETNHRYKTVMSSAAVIGVCAIGAVSAIAIAENFPRFSTAMSLSLAVFGIVSYVVTSKCEEVLKTTKMRDHENYRIQRSSLFGSDDDFIIIPKPTAQPRVITDFTSGKFI